MKVLIACEFSGIVREAFKKKGHDAWSCDVLPTEIGGKHFQADIYDVLSSFVYDWDLMVAFPPCTYLASSGARWWKGKAMEQERAVRFVQFLLGQDVVRRVAVENPIGILSTRHRKPDQIIQPWQFGHGETKATCLWLKNLPLLKPTNIVEGREGRVWKESPSPDRWKNRSRAYQGIADAMAATWGI